MVGMSACVSSNPSRSSWVCCWVRSHARRARCRAVIASVTGRPSRPARGTRSRRAPTRTLRPGAGRARPARTGLATSCGTPQPVVEIPANRQPNHRRHRPFILLRDQLEPTTIGGRNPRGQVLRVPLRVDVVRFHIHSVGTCNTHRIHMSRRSHYEWDDKPDRPAYLHKCRLSGDAHDRHKKHGAPEDRRWYLADGALCGRQRPAWC